MLRLINYSRYFAAAKDATRLAILLKSEQSKKIARFFKSSPDLSDIIAPIDSSESHKRTTILLPKNELFVLSKNVSNAINSNEYSIIRSLIQEADDSTLVASLEPTALTHYQLRFTTDTILEQLRENYCPKSSMKINDMFTLSHTFSNPTLQDLIRSEKSTLVLVFDKDANRATISLFHFHYLKNVLTFNQNFGINGSFVKLLQLADNYGNYCVVPTPDCIIVGNKDTFEEVCRCDWTGKEILLLPNANPDAQ